MYTERSKKRLGCTRPDLYGLYGPGRWQGRWNQLQRSRRVDHIRPAALAPQQEHQLGRHSKYLLDVRGVHKSNSGHCEAHPRDRLVCRIQTGSVGRLYDIVLVCFDNSSGSSVVIPKPGDVPELSPRFVTNRAFCNSGPTLSPAMRYPANILAVLAKQFLFAGTLPAYYSACPYSNRTGHD